MLFTAKIQTQKWNPYINTVLKFQNSIFIKYYQKLKSEKRPILECQENKFQSKIFFKSLIETNKVKLTKLRNLLFIILKFNISEKTNVNRIIFVSTRVRK